MSDEYLDKHVPVCECEVSDPNAESREFKGQIRNYQHAAPRRSVCQIKYDAAARRLRTDEFPYIP